MNKGLIVLSGVLLVLLAVGCGSSGDSNSTTVGDTSSTDDTESTNQKVTYTEVQAIIEANCFNCHNSPTANNAPMSLTTHLNVSFFANSIADRINRNEGSTGFMPTGGTKLSDADIEKIEEWITEGKPDN